jgi:uncharacterized coiled-coil DUF342 family protein
MLGFTFITDSKLSMYKEKAIKSENLAKEIEEIQDKADFYKERLSELKSDIASKDKEILSIGKDLSESKEKIDALKENQKKLIKSVKKKTEEFDAINADLDKAKSDLDEANYKIRNLEEKKSNALIEARIRIGDLENEVSVGSKTIQELESKLKLMQVELRGYQIGIIGKDKNDVAEPELDKDGESDKDVAEPEKSDVVPETDVIQEEAGDIVEPENEAERVKDTKKKKKKK